MVATVLWWIVLVLTILWGILGVVVFILERNKGEYE